MKRLQQRPKRRKSKPVKEQRRKQRRLKEQRRNQL